MHSQQDLLKEVEVKLGDVQNAWCACEDEKDLLNKNLTSTKQAVKESFKRHIGTLQCRAKWLVCHADSLFHLKEGSLSQQAAELESISNDLKSCLDACHGSWNTEEDIKMMAKNVLQDASKVSLQPCESGLMSFVAHDDKMEERIVCFGDIDVSSAFDPSDGYDLLSDEGIVIMRNCNQGSIEMEVKSIEMHHLTSQSANSEKEDFERIEMEMQPVNSEVTSVLSQLSQGDSAVGEETDISKSVDWLHPSSIINPITAPNNCANFNSHHNVVSEKKPSDVYDCTDKVPLWVINCEETNPWIRHSHYNTTTVESMPKIEGSSTGSFISSKDEHIDNDSSLKSQKRSFSQANLSHMNCIAQAADSKFLRIDIENKNKSVDSLDSALNSMKLTNHLRQSAYTGSTSDSSTNIRHFIDIWETSNSKFLRADTSNMANSVYLLNSTFNQTLLLDEEPKITSDSGSGRNYSTLESNHIDHILHTPESDYLVPQETSGDDQMMTATYTKSTNAVNYLRILEKQPDHMFLRSDGKSKMFDPAMCEWLRGSSADRCVQCYYLEGCSFNSTLDAKWIKTATDW